MLAFWRLDCQRLSKQYFHLPTTYRTLLSASLTGPWEWDIGPGSGNDFFGLWMQADQKCSAWKMKVVSPAVVAWAHSFLIVFLAERGPHRKTPTRALPASPCRTASTAHLLPRCQTGRPQSASLWEDLVILNSVGIRCTARNGMPKTHVSKRPCQNTFW